MDSVEEDFPRGGSATKGSDSKVKPVALGTEVDNLFQTHEPAARKRKGAGKDDGKKFKKPKPTKEKEETLTLNAGVRCVEILHVKNLKEGMLLLGCVKDVTEFEITVGLPSGLQGYLSIQNISDSYTKLLSATLDTDDTEEISSLPDLFRPGMVLRCALSKLDLAKGGSVSIQLSINPKMVNKGLSPGSLRSGMILSGCVESVEDHGYIVDVGLSGTNAFLPKQAAQDKHNNPEELKVGQYVTCRLDEVKSEGRVVRLSINPTVISKAQADAQHGWTLTSLLPGLLLKAQVTKVTKQGLVLEFLSSFSGVVDVLHMEPDRAASYAVGDEVRACILYVEPSTRLVSLSLRAHLLQPGAAVEPLPARGDRIGEVLEACKMTALYHGSGATLQLPDQTGAFVHRNHLKESFMPSNENRILAAPEHTCRILDFSPMDQTHFASLRKSVIDRPFFRYHDLQAGLAVEGTVSILLNHGMVVKLTDHIKGLVPKTHLSDILLKNPEKKYTEGMTVKCRVLSVEPDRKVLTLTRKKTLVESTLPLFLTYADARPGRVSHGYIVCVKDFGCIVRFYNDVKGLVPVKELSSGPVLSPGEMFYIGQVVKAKVLQSDPEKEKMVLSFKAVADKDPTDDIPKSLFDFEVGKKLEAKVLKKSPSGLEVAILPEETRAALPTMHLSDHTSNCPLLWEALQEGDTVSNLVCLSKAKDSITLTKKPAVKRSLEEGLVVKDFADITVGMQLIGWIKNIMSYGVFVEFPYGLFGLAPKSAMSDRFVGDATSACQLGQTVLAKVTNLDQDKRRFLVTLKASEVMTPEGDAQARLMTGLQERRVVADMVSSRDDSDLPQLLSSLSVGQKLTLVVDTEEEEGGASFKTDQLPGASIQANKYHAGGNTTPGRKVTAVVLHVDLLSSRVHVSVLPKLVEKKKTLKEGSQYPATVQYADRDFAVVSLDETGHLTVIQTSHHLNDTIRLERMLPGKRLSLTVADASCPELEGLPLVAWDVSAPKRQRTASEGQVELKGHRYGEVVTGTVQTIRPMCVMVALGDGVVGSVHVSEVAEGAALGTFPTFGFKAGTEVTARVIGGREAASHRFLPFSHARFKYSIPELTLIPSKLDESVELTPINPKEKLNSYKVGEEIRCFVSKYHPDKKSLELTTNPLVTGTVELLAMIKDPKDAAHPEKLYKLGQAVSATVVEVKPSKPQRFALSLTGVHKLAVGSTVLGIVTGVHPHMGVQIKLPFGATGTASVMDLSDSYRPKPLDVYSKEQVVRCFILGNEKDKWQLSLRPSRVNPEQAKAVKDPEVLSIEQLKQGQLIRGYIKTVAEHGIFIRLSRSITGRAEFQKTTKYFVSNHKLFTQHLPLNHLLTAKVLSVDIAGGLVDLSLLEEDTGKGDVLPSSLGLTLHLSGEEKTRHDALRREKKRRLSESQPDQADKAPKKKKKSKKGRPEDSDSGVEVFFREEEEEEEKPTEEEVKVAPPSRLQVSSGFSWDAGLSSLKPASSAQDGAFSDEEELGESTQPQKKSRHELALEKQQAEKALVKREVELMDPGRRPQDTSAFERLLLASPDSSLLWLQYMAHHLQATQIEQARAVAERALKTISFREEQEKLNVWVALMNLENMYGTEESLKKVFERALQFCEPMPVYQQLADIYAKSSKTKEAESLYKTMVKRFRDDKAVWLSYGTFLLQQGEGDAASTLLQRALKSLPSKESVDVIAKFAQLEFRYGDAVKGCSMFDKVLSSYPKRTDLWSVFIDLTVKHGSQKEIRALFDRVIHLSVAVKKIKFFFKRYLDYEKKHGTPESIQAVKEKALEYVEAKGTQAAC